MGQNSQGSQQKEQVTSDPELTKPGPAESGTKRVWYQYSSLVHSFMCSWEPGSPSSMFLQEHLTIPI